MPEHTGLGEADAETDVGNEFTVTDVVTAVADVHPLLSVTVTLYTPAPVTAIDERVGF